MRIFQTQSMWDAKEGRWYEVFSVDGESCSGEEYFRELEVEQCLEDDEIELEEYCQCCECKDNEDCPDFECTCGEFAEVENGNVDEYLEIPCQCETCCESRGEFDDEDICSECGETDCVCDYEECQCNDCRSQRHDDIVNASVGKAFEKIMNADGCEGCIVEALYEMSLEMKRLGWSDHKDYIDQCNC